MHPTLNTSPTLLNRNESYFEPISELAQLFESWDWQGSLRFYALPEDLRQLEKTLATHLGQSNVGRVCLFHGAEDALLKLFLLKRISHQTLLLPDFSWNQYRVLAQGLDYDLQTFPVTLSNQQFAFDTQELDSILQGAKNACLVLLPCPNNPTGHSIDPKDVEALAQNHPGHCFLLDGVYEPFPTRFCRILDRHPNCYFMSSLSKFFGLPGLRFGYAVGDFPRALQMDLGPQKLSVAAASTVLACVPKFEAQWQHMLTDAETLRQLIITNVDGAQAFVTHANFLLVDVSSHTQIGHNALEAARHHNILPKVFRHQDRNYIRWSLGPPHIMTLLIEWTHTWARLNSH